VETLAPAYGDDWWYAGMLAFVRQEQERWTEAAALAARALAAEPASGHAVHARAHIHYETGDHRPGLRWLDDWITRRAPQAHHGAHFSWPAALHELSLEDAAAVRRRYREQSALPQVAGLRAYVEGRYDAAAVRLMAVRRNEVALGGSAAQREVIEDTLLDALLAAGRLAQARSLLEHRLDRRQSRRDQRRLYQLTGFPESRPA